MVKVRKKQKQKQTNKHLKTKNASKHVMFPHEQNIKDEHIQQQKKA